MDNVALWVDETILGGVIGGAAIGLFVVLFFWTTGKAVGASTAYGNVCAIGSRMPFFRGGDYEKILNWRLMFWLGLPLGGLVAMLTSPDAVSRGPFYMGERYETLFAAMLPGGGTLWLKGGMLFVGGTLLGLGSRMAGGCQSGHSICGMSQLNPPSLVASIGFFAGGIIAVQVMFRVAGVV